MSVLSSNPSGASVRLTLQQLAAAVVSGITDPVKDLPVFEQQLEKHRNAFKSPFTPIDQREMARQEIMLCQLVIHLLKQAIALQAPTAAVKAAFDALKAEDATIAGLQAQLEQAQARRVTLATAVTQTSKELADKKAVWEATNPPPE